MKINYNKRLKNFGISFSASECKFKQKLWDYSIKTIFFVQITAVFLNFAPIEKGKTHYKLLDMGHGGSVSATYRHGQHPDDTARHRFGCGVGSVV
jgi:hypothetical protein